MADNTPLSTGDASGMILIPELEDLALIGTNTYYNKETDRFYTSSNEANWGLGRTFVRLPLGSNLDKEYRKRFLSPGKGVEADYNPLLNKDKGNALEVRLRRSYDEETPDPSHIRFPHDMSIGQGDDYVLFSFYDYQPPFKNRNIPLGNQLNETLAQYNQTGYSSQYFKADKSEYPQIVMYMPQDIQDSFKADWEGKAFGSITAGLIAAAGQKGAGNKIKQTVDATSGALDRAGVNTAANLITGLAQKITGDQISADDLFGGISGVARNPNTELLFQKMNMRTFDLTFKMAPFDQMDAYSMEAVIQLFKQAMLPQYKLGKGDKVFGYEGGDSGGIQAGFIKVPKICSVNFMRGNAQNTHLPRYKMCAITNVDVNYTPDGTYASFAGGPPVAVQLKVSFMETKLVFSEDVQDRGF